MCKHLNGYLVENVDAWTNFCVVDGKVEEIGDNEIGNISGYLYHCNDCGREWKWKAFPRLRWQQKIAEQLLLQATPKGVRNDKQQPQDVRLGKRVERLH